MKALRSLNSNQLKAVRHDTGPALVIAGAGTGKTSVISTRIAFLIKNKGISPEKILALTFTEKAASEMQDRVDSILPYGALDCDILTFNALGDKILRDNAHDIGLSSDFVVMSNFQQSIVMQQVLEDLELKYHKSLSNPYGFSKSLISFISKLKDENISSDNFSKFSSKYFNKHKKSNLPEAERVVELSNIYTHYTKLCEQNGLIDYGDQIVKVIELFEKNNAVLKKYQMQYDYVLIDEFQDTNFSQWYLVKLLSKKHQNVMVVGDDDQSIYRFRGANVSNILNFEKNYSKIDKIVLNTNYRSVQTVLDKAYNLIQHNNPYRLEVESGIVKKLVSQKKAKGKVKFNQYATIIEEAQQVAERIADLTKKHKIKYSDIAILLRKNSQAQTFANALSEHNIDFVIEESQDLFEQAEIKALINFIQALNDPKSSSAIYGLLASEIYNVPLNSIVEMSSAASRSHTPLEEYLRTNSINSQSIQKALSDLDKYRGLEYQMSSGQLLYRYLQDGKYLNTLVDQSLKDSKAALKIQNIAQFFSIVKEFERISSNNKDIYSLWRYLNNVISSEADILIQPSPLDVNAVSILTIHKAKGLEFNTVFVVDLNEQTFPSVNRSDQIAMPEGLFSADQEKINWHILEERRLFYVAMTRAKERLFLTCAPDHGGKRLKKPSRFIQESLGIQPDSSMLRKTSANIDFINSFSILPDKKFNPISRYLREDGWLHLSTNQIADYLRSPQEFWYFNVLNLPKGPFHALVYGSAMHAALEVYYRFKQSGNIPPLKDLYEAYDNSWVSEGFVSLQHEKDRYKNGKLTLKKFYNKHNKLSEKPQYIEKPFVLRIKELKLEISGRYDAVFNENNGSEIRDFKTSEVKDIKHAQKKLKDSIQMQIYALAWGTANKNPIDYVSLYFIENDILVKTDAIDRVKTLKKLKEVCEGIRSAKFDSRGSSTARLGRYL